MLELQKISKYYPAGFGKSYVLRQIDLTIREGEFVSIMGPSGSGKSTLLHILGLLEEPSEGEYLFLNEPVQKLSEKRRTDLHRNHIGFVFQAYHLIDELTVYENIETPLLYKGVSSSERKSRVAELLDRFNMVAKKDLFPHQLSGGQQQLVGVARALVHQPKVIFADEPTGNLHSEQAVEIMELFKKLNQQDGVTIVQVTHSEANHLRRPRAAPQGRLDGVVGRPGAAAADPNRVNVFFRKAKTARLPEIGA
jgi:putative ABC transport system ATP-binding protein